MKSTTPMLLYVAGPFCVVWLSRPIRSSQSCSMRQCCESSPFFCSFLVADLTQPADSRAVSSRKGSVEQYGMSISLTFLNHHNNKLMPIGKPQKYNSPVMDRGMTAKAPPPLEFQFKEKNFYIVCFYPFIKNPSRAC